MLVYDLAAQTLVQMLLDLGADYVATHSYGNTYVSPNTSDQWVNARIQSTLMNLMGSRSVVGVPRNVLAFSLSPLRAARLIVSAVPGGYVVAVVDGLESWLALSVARKLVDAIETWSSQR